MEENIKVTRIPVPNIITNGEWVGIVYAIETRGKSIDEHNRLVVEETSKIREEFDDGEHDSVSLRIQKEEMVYSDEQEDEFSVLNYFVTLVQFRIRDSY